MVAANAIQTLTLLVSKKKQTLLDMLVQNQHVYYDTLSDTQGFRVWQCHRDPVVVTHYLAATYGWVGTRCERQGPPA